MWTTKETIPEIARDLLPDAPHLIDEFESLLRRTQLVKSLAIIRAKAGMSQQEFPAKGVIALVSWGREARPHANSCDPSGVGHEYSRGWRGAHKILHAVTLWGKKTAPKAPSHYPSLLEMFTNVCTCGSTR